MRELFVKLKRFISFGIVGCINTLVDFLVFTLCYSAIGLEESWSQVVGYGTGVICSFLLNRRFTFRDGTRRLWGQVLLFIAVNLVSMVLSAWLIEVLTDTALPALWGAWRYNAYAAKIFVTLLVMVINFFGYKHLVFRVGKDEGK